jgi:hypothetical protein
MCVLRAARGNPSMWLGSIIFLMTGNDHLFVGQPLCMAHHHFASRGQRSYSSNTPSLSQLLPHNHISFILIAIPKWPLNVPIVLGHTIINGACPITRAERIVSNFTTQSCTARRNRPQRRLGSREMNTQHASTSTLSLRMNFHPQGNHHHHRRRQNPGTPWQPDQRVKRTIHFDSFPPPPPPPPPTELEPSEDAQDAQDAASQELLADEEVIEEESDLDLGRPSRMSMEDQQGIILSVTPHDQVMASLYNFTPHDQVMACLYKLCNDAGAPPKYLCDDLVAVIREKKLKNNFNILSPAISKRRTFFQRVKKQLEIPGPEAIPCNLGVFWQKSYRRSIDIGSWKDCRDICSQRLTQTWLI